ncbi:hypothetical protein L7F22_006180 [Adiantum nelumboides]|nr:hypothetical protein [Adiantum nelumboides]
MLVFYVFLSPFLGSSTLEYVAFVVYSPVAIAVFILYFRSTAIDPSDPGTDDNCRDDGGQPPPVSEEEALFCTLCNVEVCKLSKHCRNCDKCVDGFDHHCRWLNNCVGRKNYITFVVLMASSLLLLVLNWGTGIAVLVRCIVSKSNIERKILERLGSGFSRTPFAIVVALCTLVALLASIPLGELFFFHLILIKKGITTYEYVMAMRAQSEVQGAPDGEEKSVPTSPSSSTATGLSRTSSLGLHYRGAWCTPPRVFVENQASSILLLPKGTASTTTKPCSPFATGLASTWSHPTANKVICRLCSPLHLFKCKDEVVPHLAPGRVPSTVDPDVDNPSMKSNSRSQKNVVKISAWKLAKLDPNEAARAAAKARRSSSVLRPLKIQDLSVADTDYTSTMSSRSSISTEIGHVARGNGGEVMGYSPQVLQGLPFGRAGSKGDVVDTRTQSSCSSPSRASVNESAEMSPLPSHGRITAPVPPRSTTLAQPLSQMPSISGLPPGFRHALPNQNLTSATALDYSNHLRRLSGAPVYDEYIGQSRVSQVNRNLRESKRTAVFWSEGAGRFGSSGARSNFSNLEETLLSSGSICREQCGSQAHTTPENAVQVSSEVPGAVSGLPENLLYSGASIFFGGPICTPTSLHRNNSINVGVIDHRTGSSRIQNHANRPSQGPCLQRSQSPVFAPSSSPIETMFFH